MTAGFVSYTSTLIDGVVRQEEPSLHRCDPSEWAPLASELVRTTATDGNLVSCDIVFFGAQMSDAAERQRCFDSALAAALAIGTCRDDLSSVALEPIDFPQGDLNADVFVGFTRPLLGFQRVWLLCSTAPFEGSSVWSLSGILVTDDETGREGALRQYIACRGRLRQHSLATAHNDRMLPSSPGIDVDAGVVRYFQRMTAAGCALQQSNAESAARLFSLRLQQLGSVDCARVQLSADSDEIKQSVETAKFNSVRAESVCEYASFRAAERFARDGVYATLWLATVAGVVAAVALASGARDRAAAGMLVGGFLASFGLVFVDWSRRVGPIHRLCTGLCLGVAGQGLSVLERLQRWEGLAGVVGFFVVGIFLTYVQQRTRSSLETRWHWQSGSLRPKPSSRSAPR